MIAKINATEQQLLPAALKALGDYSQFVIWRYEPQRIASDGKTYPAGELRKAGYSDSDIEKLMINEMVKAVKAPINPATLNHGSSLDSANWLTASDALARAATLNQANGNGTQPYGVGFSITKHDPFMCVDLDNAAVNGQWKPIIQDVLTYFPGCAVEVSHSGRGLHVWGKISGPLPEHKKKIRR